MGSYVCDQAEKTALIFSVFYGINLVTYVPLQFEKQAHWISCKADGFVCSGPFII